MIRSALNDKVFTFTEESSLFLAPCHLVVGVSGGADSMALLHVLTQWRQPGLQITAVHLHHGLRGVNADRDAAFVEEQCALLGVPVRIYHADVEALAAAAGCGVEEAGRRERYRVFHAVCDELQADHIITAHHADDQVETVLMHLIRGTGMDGLRGIPVARGRIRRPLLSCTRQEIETYCREHAIPYMTDETNADMRYTRNRIRHEVLPLLRQINPAVDDALRRLSSHASADSQLLCTMAQQALEAGEMPEGGHAASAFVDQPQSVRRRMILKLLALHTIPSVEEKHILDIEQALLTGSGSVLLPSGVCLRVNCGHVFIHSPEVESELPDPIRVSDLPCVFTWLGRSYRLVLLEAKNAEERQKIHKLFFKYSLDYDRIHSDLYVRARQTGDTIHPAGRGVGKTLKKLMNEYQISDAERNRFPLVCEKDSVLLIPGYTCDERVRITEHTKHFLVWQFVDELG